VSESVPESTPPCRSCGSAGLVPFLSLGKTPLADALVPADRLGAEEPTFPLDVAFCPHCTLVQILEEVPAHVLFGEDYPYYSSFSEHLLKHSREHVEGLLATRGLGPDSLVVEIASNDGYLLRNVVEAGVPALGIEPTPGPAAAAREAGVPTLERFFGDEFARELVAEGRRADVIVANNVMAHVPDLNGFVAGMATLLKPDGLITVENPYVRDLIEHCEFDTIYHEHFCYYSCTSVDNLVRRHGLFLNHVEYFPNLHGGTLRWHIGAREEPTETVLRYLADERRDGLTEAAHYADFAARVEQVRTDLLALLRRLKADGATIAGYGAAAKGSTLINYVGIDGDLLDFVVDRNVHKQGRHMPGMHQPILPPEALLSRMPSHTLLLAWNFADEIVRQQQAYRERGGTFIVPVPTPRVLS
jgi:SAM-dependent methyltransferase